MNIPIFRSGLAAALSFLVTVCALAQTPSPRPPQLEIAGRPEQPVTLKSVRINTDIRGSLALTSSGRFYTAHVTRAQFAARGMVEVAVPGADRPRSYSQVLDGRTYFYAEVPAAVHSAPRPMPRTVALCGTHRHPARNGTSIKSFSCSTRISGKR